MEKTVKKATVCKQSKSRKSIFSIAYIKGLIFPYKFIISIEKVNKKIQQLLTLDICRLIFRVWTGRQENSFFFFSETVI